MSRTAKYAVVVAVLGAAVAALLLLPVNRWALDLVEWIGEAGVRGAVVFAAAYVITTVLFVPGFLLTLGAGFAYGPLWGTLLVSPASVLGATLAFVLGRSVTHDWVAHRVDQWPRFAAIDTAIGESGFKIVFLLRLSPIFPFNLLNYALGLTRVGLRDYILASFLGMLPGTFFYVYLGSLVTSTSELTTGDGLSGIAGAQILYWGGLVATVVVMVVITRVARRALRQAIERQAPAHPISATRTSETAGRRRLYER